MPGTGTWGNIGTTDPDENAFTLHMIDASGDTWTERLVVAITATLTAVQAWIALYQTAIQASVWKVTREQSWEGAADVGNALFGPRFGGETGINMSFREATSGNLFPLRVISPVPDAMQGANDIPDMGSDELSNLVTATIGLLPTYDFRVAQYTVHRERKGNARVIG